VTKSEVKNLEKRLEGISEPRNAWIPPWLRAVGSQEEIAEWRAICRVRRGFDFRERESEFIHEMRKKHPNMPLAVEEIVEEGGRKYAASELESSKE
jgi:hypothetical protein